jgi:CRISPR-associated endonuclease/helicase Cas3
MAPLHNDQFGDFFRSVHGHAPFAWQTRFAGEVLSKGFHDVLRVPTASGKTSILDVAVFQMAIEADRKPENRTAARRICFIVDRRLVVDEVTEHAMKILKAIQATACGQRDEPALKAVADRLACLAAIPGVPLRVIRLRGSVYRDEGWAADPLTPTIIVSTVDQIGSRLLFRGYGVGRRSRALQAGLLAFDTRAVLDEAHLSSVFAETVRSVRRFQGWAEQSPASTGRLLGITKMSATTTDSGRSFELCDAERRDERLALRLEAPKPSELVEAQVGQITKQMRQAQAREFEQKNRTLLVEELVRCAKKLGGFGGEKHELSPPRVIGVVVNRVATARAVFDRLNAKEGGASECDAILLTGRIRPFDRDRLLEAWLPKIKAGREVELENHPLFVVATQTVEVGANLDFDALATEAAPLDSLRQRFGRLDRLGARHVRQAPSPAFIVIRSDRAKKSEDDRIYGPAVAETWKWLKSSKVATSIGKGKAKRISVDFGVNALDEKLQACDKIASMVAQQKETPLLFPAHLDAWIQTDPIPEPDPDVAPFLHGRAVAPADVQVIWRADLSEQNEHHWGEIVALMPPRTREAVPVPVHEVRAWLTETAQADIADVEGGSEDTRPARGRYRRKALRWRGKDNARPVNPSSIRPGDTIVVPAGYRGTDLYGWNPGSSRPVEDVAESCLAEVIASYPVGAFRCPKLRLRLHRKLLPDAAEVVRNRWLLLLDLIIEAVRSDADNAWPLIQRLLRETRGYVSSLPHVATIDEFLRLPKCPNLALYPDGFGLILIGTIRLSLGEVSSLSEGETEYEDPEEDEGSFSPGGQPVPLDAHSASVARTARDFASQCGLAAELTEVLAQTGCWHDEGKRDPRFQALLHGSELKALAALGRGQFLAKSGRDSGQWQSSQAFGYPRGARHEFVSVRLFDEMGPPSGQRTDLIRFLIGTHHGRGRPFPPVLSDPLPVEITLAQGGKDVSISSDHGLYRLDSGWVELFWKMVRRYGWWGIAYLEALIVTADRFVSAREQQAPQVAPAQAEQAAVAEA